jgi:hypothetical protein
MKPLDDLRLSHRVDGRPTRRSIVGNQNISLSVTDLDDIGGMAPWHTMTVPGTGTRRR